MSTGDKFVGKDVTVWIVDPVGGTPVFIGGQSEGTFNREAETIDVTSKKPPGQGAKAVVKEKLAGSIDWSIELEGFVVADDRAYELLETAFLNGDPVTAQWRSATGKTREGKAYVTDFPEEAPLDDGWSFSITLEGNGAYEVKDNGEGGGVEG